MIPNFHKVNNKLYRGGALSPSDVVVLHNKFNINKIVSLDYEVGKRIDNATKLLGIKHIMLPIEIGRKGSLLKFLSYDIDKLLLDEGPTFIGCAAGKDRTGLAIALFRCEHDGWSCEKALKEAYSFGFGIGVDPKIIHLYKKIIAIACGCHHNDSEDKNDAYDITSNQREYPSDYNDYTLDTWQQQSWSPYNDYRVREFPFAPVDNWQEEQYPNRLDYGLNDAPYPPKNTNEIPQIGIYDNATNGINGAGPSMIGSGIMP